MDCDVEEPNGHLFLHPVFRTKESVTMPVPVVDPALCDGCGACRRLCQYGAIAILKEKAHVFTELCHSCGGCALICPKHAIHEEPRELGFVEEGDSGSVRFVRGTLNVGQPLAPAVIRAVKRRSGMAKLVLIDSPPGTACAMVAAVRGADAVLLVTEPTPFGLHDLKLAVSTVRALGIPLGVIINRAESEGDLVSRWCAEANIEVRMRIPDDRRIAEAYSRGEPITQAAPHLIGAFRKLLAGEAT
jgi:MinD superfamily P-loop ATPase